MKIMKVSVEKLPNKTYKLTITVEAEAVDKEFTHSLFHFSEHAKIEGFREGKAPISMVKEKIDKGELNGNVINHLIPHYFQQAIKEHHLNPITEPKIELKQFSEGKDLIFLATIIERPDIEIGNYTKALQSTKTKDKSEKPTVEQLVNKVLEVSKIEIAPILIENEVSRMLSNLIDQTSKLGITVDNYLQSQRKTIEELRVEYSKAAELNIKAEFLLNEIADKQKITVDDIEVQKTIDAAPDEESKKLLSKDDQKWYIRSILRKNKVIQHLIDLAFEDEKNE